MIDQFDRAAAARVFFSDLNDPAVRDWVHSGKGIASEDLMVLVRLHASCRLSGFSEAVVMANDTESRFERHITGTELTRALQEKAKP